MGEVYRAVDTRLGRSVAVKIVPENLSSQPERLHRFEKEARAASSLNHPNIVTIYDIGVSNAHSYIAMELVEGKSVRELLNTGPVPLRRLFSIGAQLTDGLAKAHEAGIVHRDLKPENLMVTRDGFLKILDFGLAKLTQPGSESERDVESGLATMTGGTEPGVVMGTAGYMSPEQASGRPLDFRSDQFAVGSILYEMATGTRAFDRPTAVQTQSAIIQDEPASLASANPKLPVNFCWIVERCLAKEPEERYSATRDLARDLAMLRDHASEISASGVLQFIRPKKKRLLLLAALVVASMVGVSLLLGARIGEKKALEGSPPRFRQLTFRRGFLTGARFAPDGQTVVYSAAWEGNRPEVFSMRVGRPEARPLGFPDASLFALSTTGEIALSLGASPALTDGAIRRPGIWIGTLARVPLSGGAPREIQEQVRWADWWGSDLLAIRRSNGKTLLDFPIGKSIRATDQGLQNPRVSPQGDLAAFAELGNSSDATSLLVTDREGHARALTRGWSEFSGLAWRASGREVCFSARRKDGDPGLFSVTLSGRVRLLARWPGSWAVMDIASDGRLLATRSTRRTALLASLPGEQRERDLSWFDSSRLVDLSADGKTILFEEMGPSTEGGPVAFVRSVDGSPPVRLADGYPRALSGDGKSAFVEPVSGSGLIAVPTGAGEARQLARGDVLEWSFVSGFPDGRRVAFAGRDRKGWEGLYLQEMNGEPHPLGEKGLDLPFVSPDGRMVQGCFHHARGTTIKIYSTEAGPDAGPLQTLELPDNVAPSGWSADGKGLLIRRSGPDQSVVLIEWMDLTTGQRKPLREFRAQDPAGALAGIGYILVAQDGKSYAYSLTRDFSDLYIVEGLR